MSLKFNSIKDLNASIEDMDEYYYLEDDKSDCYVVYNAEATKYSDVRFTSDGVNVKHLIISAFTGNTIDYIEELGYDIDTIVEFDINNLFNDFGELHSVEDGFTLSNASV